MANEKNLIPLRTLSTAEAKKRGRKGGIKSGETRRRKKLLKDCMIQLLELPVSDMKSYNKLMRMGLSCEDIDNRALLTAALFKKAVDTGDVAAFKEIRELVGEQTAEEENGKLQNIVKAVDSIDK